MLIAHRKHFSAGYLGGIFTLWEREIGAIAENKPLGFNPLAAWSADKHCCKSHAGNMSMLFTSQLLLGISVTLDCRTLTLAKEVTFQLKELSYRRALPVVFGSCERKNHFTSFNAIRLCVSCFDGDMKLHKPSAVTAKSCNNVI